jgi:hypothetical protein
MGFVVGWLVEYEVKTKEVFMATLPPSAFATRPRRLLDQVRPGQLVWAPLRRQRIQGIVLDVYRREAGRSGFVEETCGAGDLCGRQLLSRTS